MSVTELKPALTPLERLVRAEERCADQHHWPDVTANRAETEPDRLERLLRLSGILCGRLRPLEFDKIERLHDHKGDLTVFLSVYPSWAGSGYIEREVIAAWEVFNEYNVEFRYMISDEER